MTWTGFTLTEGKRIARISRAHGNWLAIAYDRNGQPSSGEYFAYGEPGALQRAKEWCEQRLIPRKAKR